MMTSRRCCQLVLMGLGLLGLSACRERLTPTGTLITPTDCYSEITSTYRGRAPIFKVEAPASASSDVPVTLVVHYILHGDERVGAVPETATFSADLDRASKSITVSGAMDYNTYASYGHCAFIPEGNDVRATADLGVVLPAGAYEIRIASGSFEVVYGHEATRSLTVE